MTVSKTSLINQYRTQMDVYGPGFPSQILGQEIGPRLYGYLLANSIDPSGYCGRRIHSIPSETTVGERNFLFTFFSEIWNGEQDVLEVGPFLGGTTLCIALGMKHCARRVPDRRLYTFDKFSDYYDQDNLKKFLAPLIQSNILSERDLKDLGKSAPFKAIFDVIHSNREYSDILLASEGILPDSVAETGGLPHLFKPPEKKVFNAVFVDGCKGWYQTKYFMEQMCPLTPAGSHYIFQDYGWRTCFWIPLIVELLREHFSLIAYIDNTYTFELIKPLSTEVLNQRVPDQPEQLEKNFYRDASALLQTRAIDRGDGYGAMFHGLQYAGALAYLGHRVEAKNAIEQLRKQPYFGKYDSLFAAALVSPTYNAYGPVYL